jgi:hypothetical protein
MLQSQRFNAEKDCYMKYYGAHCNVDCNMSRTSFFYNKAILRKQAKWLLSFMWIKGFIWSIGIKTEIRNL